MKFGSKVGAAFGGALGVAASPLVVPGLALAALLGGGRRLPVGQILGKPGLHGVCVGT